MGPNYQAPENSVPDEWQGAEAGFSSEEPLTTWWEVFQDPLLNKYIEKAASNNNDLLAAEANILQARALRQVAASSLFPQIFADVNATKTYFSKNGPVFAGGAFTGGTSAATGLPFAIQVPQIQNLFNALFDATWEIDLFGKTRRGVEAAEATIDSASEQRNTVLLSLLAEVARNYMEIRGNQKKALLIEQYIELLENNAEIIQKQLESGYANQLDYEKIEADLATARSQFPAVYADMYRGIFTLSILTGDLPEALVDELLPLQPLPKPPNTLAVGLRSDLLRRRPDVRQAERQLAVATANIGVAVASFYPTITLNGDGGFQSLQLRDLFKWSSRTWAYGGDVNMPIFLGGSLVGNLKATEATAAATAYTYQQTVLNALQDAESALISYTEDLKTTSQLNESSARNERLVHLTSERYTKGLVNKLNLISSQLQWNTAEQSLLQSETKTLLDLVSLYKALGGGWESDHSLCSER